ncbi:hypothetical protein VCSRO83_0440 [Vibrio cholerae]|nr:hypothetical protein VCSRO83_0440 [Vibrio cholerae]
MAMNIEQRLEQSAKSIEQSSQKAHDFAEKDTTLQTCAGSRDSLPKVSRVWQENFARQMNQHATEFQDRFALSQQSLPWQASITISDSLQRYHVGVQGEEGYKEFLPNPLKLPFETAATLAEDLTQQRWLENGVPNKHWTEIKVASALEKSLGVNARVWPKDRDLQVGDVIPSAQETADGLPITHLVVDGNAYAMSPLANGNVADLKNSGATIGGVSVKLIQPFIYTDPLYYGGDGTGNADSTNAVLSAMMAAALVGYGEWTGGLTYKVSGKILPDGMRNTVVRFNNCALVCATKNAKVFSGKMVVKNDFYDLRMIAQAEGVVLREIYSETGDSVSSQLNNFYNFKMTALSPTVAYSVIYRKTWSNRDYGGLIQNMNGPIFGELGDVANACNDNKFINFELRCSSQAGVNIRPLVNNSGDNNGFVGGAIQNWPLAAQIHAGSLFCDKVYLEAFNSATAFEQFGGSLDLTGCFRESSVRVYGGVKLNVTDPDLIDMAKYTLNFPMIQRMGNTDTNKCVIAVKAQQRAEDVTYIMRPDQHRDVNTLAWSDNTTAGGTPTYGYDKFDVISGKFKANLEADRANVTGDGTNYIIDFGNNEKWDSFGYFDDKFFEPKYCGLYDFSASVNIQGLNEGAQIEVYFGVYVGGAVVRKSFITRRKVQLGDLLGANAYMVNGATTLRINPGEKVALVAKATLAAPALSVTIVRGNALDDYTSLRGSYSI